MEEYFIITPIEKVQVGDYVKTMLGKVRKVVRKGVIGGDTFISVKGNVSGCSWFDDCPYSKDCAADLDCTKASPIKVIPKLLGIILEDKE